MRRTRKDHSGAPKNNLPPVPKLDLVLYHWSPTINRESIKRVGLVPYKKSLQGSWRPPCVCFSDDPLLAWTLSGNMWPEIKSWDLWLCWMESQTSFEDYELITDTFVGSGRHYIKEYRIYQRVYKRDLKYVATRVQ